MCGYKTHPTISGNFHNEEILSEWALTSSKVRPQETLWLSSEVASPGGEGI